MFIDEWFEKDYYKRLPPGYHSNHCFGQICWTHAYYPHENLQVWRPIIDPADSTKTLASSFQIVSAPADAFSRKLPLHTPALTTQEEFLVIRAKRRPVILIQTEPPLLGITNRGYKAKFHRRRAIVAQMFSIVDKATGRTKFDPDIIDRVRKMEFPQILFLPPKGALSVEGMLRLDEAQAVFVPHLEATEHCLSDGVASLLKSQIQFLLTGEHPNLYTELREMLLKS